MCECKECGQVYPIEDMMGKLCEDCWLWRQEVKV